jgi:nicotinate-nucleotide adenylyltransferase
VRIGIFGGTFDPVHHGHLVVAADACDALELDLLLLVPAGRPPHKEGTGAGAEHRLRMLQAAVAGDERFEVDDLELRREGPSFTVETLRHLRERWVDADLFFLMGADCLPDLATWREPHAIARLATVVALSRAGELGQPAVAIPFERIAVTRVDISATAVRQRIAAGRSVRYLLPESVRDIIEGEGLYR